VEKKPRLAKRGDQDVHDAQKFLFLEKVFASVMDHATETWDMIQSHSIIYRSSSKADRVDYLLQVEKIAANLDRKLRNQFRRLLMGGEIGAGSRRMLVAKLSQAFISSELFPRARWFAGSGWAEGQKKRQSALAIVMTPMQVSAVATAYISPSRNRRFDEAGAPLIVAESWTNGQEARTEIPVDPVTETDDSAFATQELSI
jgi:hypothetical protein